MDLLIDLGGAVAASGTLDDGHDASLGRAERAVVIDDDVSRLPGLLANLLADPTELLEEVQASSHDGGPLVSPRAPAIKVA